MEDHAEALAACARGDMTALERLYRAEAPLLLGIAERMLGRRDLAEEAVHDAFVQVWRRADQFDPARGPARAWLAAIVRNRAIDQLRRGAREDLADPEDITELSDRRARAEAALVEEAWRRLDAHGRLRQCLERLHGSQRRIILLAYVLGLTQSEVAGRLNLPLGTAKSWTRRGLASLRECLS